MSETIINGVDVSECEHQTYDKCAINFDEWNGEIIRYLDCSNYSNCYFKKLKRKEQECEELKIKLMQKSEIDTFFNTPIEGWDSDACKICGHKQALYEISKYIEQGGYYIPYGAKEDIHAIINKAKDGE